MRRSVLLQQTDENYVFQIQNMKEKEFLVMFKL